MKNLIPQFIQDKFDRGERYGHLHAYTMFVDLSGFTALTESLMQKGNEGAEQLSNILNRIFSPMVQLVYERNGFIPYFAGDAFTAIFPEEPDHENSRRLLQTAQEMRQLFSEKKFTGIPFPIGIKIGLSLGTVDWGIVGKEYKAFYFRGAAIDDCAESQAHAQNLEIILDQRLANVLPQAIQFNQIPNTSSFYRWDDKGKRLNVARSSPSITDTETDSEAAHNFLPESVRNYQGVGEFRPVTSVFCSFQGVETHEKLDELAQHFLDGINSFSGYFKEIDFGDKGGLLVGFFGAPVSFENNTERALEFVLSLQSELDLLDLDYRIGITYGTAFTGIVGGKERHQYAAVGNRVNLAARLMTYADWGEILADNEVRKERRYEFRHKGDIHYKGIEGHVPTYKLLGRRTQTKTSFSGSFVGRDKELQQLLQFSTQSLSTEKAGIVYIFGEAGVGKSRLIYEARRQLDQTISPNWYVCLTDQILQKPFNPFIYFLRNYFEQSPENSPEINLSNFDVNFSWLLNDLRALTHEKAGSIIKEAERTRPVLKALVGIKEKGSIWESLDAQGRHQNTLASIINLFLAESLARPVIIELEDALWLDSSSEQLLSELASRITEFPILLLIVSRYFDNGSKPEFFLEKELSTQLSQLEINLNHLSPEALKIYSEDKLGGPITDTFYEMLKRTTNGNPFYLEQLLEYFAESKLLIQKDGVWSVKDENIKLSSSIQAVLTARIDRLSTLVKETVKAAAVIGREFELPVLTEVMRRQEKVPPANSYDSALLKDQINQAEQGQIWRAMDELRYIFRHSLLREAVYDMQLRTRLRELHLLIAEAIEKIYSDQIEDHYVDLAFHYENAEVKEKTREYLKKAADHSRRNYQNQQALRFYSKLLNDLELDGEIREKFHVLLKKGRVLELIGQWQACEEVYQEAVAIASDLNEPLVQGRALNALGHLNMLQGQYKDAREQLEKSASVFESMEDEFGISKVYGDLGNLFFRQGDYEQAKSYFTKSIRLSRQFPYSYSQAQYVANLGLAFMNQGKYDEGIRWMQEQLERTQRKKDRQGMAILFTNLGIVYFEKGDYEPAQDCFIKGLELSEELGNKLLLSIASGCLGGVYERKGNYPEAQRLFELDLQLTEELGDKQGIAIAHSLLGDLYSVMGRFEEAKEQLFVTLSLSEELGYQKGIARAVNTLGDIHYFTEDYPTSLKYYDRAIQVTREINNRLVLGRSLAEKCLVLLAMDNLTEARAVQRETMKIAEDLKNPDLLFQADLLHARIDAAEGMGAPAIQQLLHLLNAYPEEENQAEIYYFLEKISPGNGYRKEALSRLQDLYDETRKYVYFQRLEDLQTSK